MKENVTLSDLKAGDILIYIGANCSQFKREFTYTVLWDNLPYELIIVDDRRNVIPIKKLNLVNFKLHPQQPERLLSEADLIVGNRFECIKSYLDNGIERFTKGLVYSVRDNGLLLKGNRNYFVTTEDLNRHFKLVSQPPVMEGKEESIYNLSVSALSTIRTIKDFCNNSGISKMAESAEKDLIKIFDNARDNVDSEKYANQKTAPLQDEIKSLRYDLFHVTANEQSLQSEVEQLKGLLKECHEYVQCSATIQRTGDPDNKVPQDTTKLLNNLSEYLSK